jgi:hypothetical protein
VAVAKAASSATDACGGGRQADKKKTRDRNWAWLICSEPCADEDRELLRRRVDWETTAAQAKSCADVKALSDAANEIFDIELSGSASLNTRLLQLAGLSGAIIALVATVAIRLPELPRVVGEATGLALVIATVFLAGTVLVALRASTPRSQWRSTLANYVEDLAHSEDRNHLLRVRAGYMLRMADTQRVTNEEKAAAARQAQCLFRRGIVTVIASSLLVVLGFTL